MIIIIIKIIKNNYNVTMWYYIKYTQELKVMSEVTVILKATEKPLKYEVSHCMWLLTLCAHSRGLQYLLTLGAHAPEGYSTCPVCLSVCVFSLFWHLAQSGVQTAVSATSARYGHEI